LWSLTLPKTNPELLVIVPYSVNFVRKTLDFVKIDSEVHQFYEKALELFSKRPVLRRRQIYQIIPAFDQFYENPPGLFAVQFFKINLNLRAYFCAATPRNVLVIAELFSESNEFFSLRPCNIINFLQDTDRSKINLQKVMLLYDSLCRRMGNNMSE